MYYLICHLVKQLENMTSLKFYHDFLSQPARAVGLLLESAQVEHEKCPVKLAEGRVCGIILIISMSITDVNCRTT